MVDATGPLVVLTREPGDNESLARQLEALGVASRQVPCLATELVRPPAWPRPPFSALTFSSRRGVRGVVEQRLWPQLQRLAPRALVAAVGPATARALEEAGIAVSLVAASGDGAGLGRQLAELLPAASRVLAVGGNLQAGGLDRVLGEAGHRLERLQVYRNIEPPIPRLEPFALAGVFVASPSAAGRLLDRNPWMRAATFFTIGDTTRRALEERGVADIVTIGADSRRWAVLMARVLLGREVLEDT